MNNIFSIDQSKCYSCSACFAICPKGAISMVKDKKGFYAPLVNNENCIDCGFCVKVCPIGKETQLKTEQSVCYGIKSKDSEQRKASTSGAAFPLIAGHYADEIPVICGCTFSDKRIRHLFSKDYKMFVGSKYVQSDIGDSLHMVGEKLLNGKRVVFVGTPCQCAGLKNYLAKMNISTEKLLTIDFVCHGTPSSGMFDEYVKYIEKKDGKELKTHYFRTKYNGWQSHTEANEYKDGAIDYTSFHSQLFKAIFCSGFCMHESCYQCGFTTKKRVSDITIADFWGVRESHPEFYDNEGVSFIMLNTDKGQATMDQIQEADVAKIIEVCIEDTKQLHLNHPIEKPEKYDEFWEYYLKRGFEKTTVKYFAAGKLRGILRKIYHTMGR